MLSLDRNQHWGRVYSTRRADQVSWFQSEARLSRALIESAAPDRSARIIDVGGGASTLVDGLVESGYHNLTVLDIAPAALMIARERLGRVGASVSWLAADVLTTTLRRASFDVWHDRAVFHFLTTPADRKRYVEQVRAAVRPGGYVLVATFAEDGPLRCSGLDVARYSPESLYREFGGGFTLLDTERELHITPAGAQQAFTYCLCRVSSSRRARAA